ncbi:MAG: hypothetical protein APR63_03980 [Desulfuromonas sp. SDB]|nr:MAG: hypothetical protein APR63_03980 [Desulfuromonas sp. SDB]
MKIKLLALLLISGLTCCALLIKEYPERILSPSETLNLFVCSMEEGDFETAVDCLSSESVDYFLNNLDDYIDPVDLEEMNVSIEQFNELTDLEKMVLIFSMEADDFMDGYTVEVLSEQIKGEQATLNVLIIEDDYQYEEDIHLILQQGQWKLQGDF